MPEVERLWFGFFKQGYSGMQLALVIRLLQRQICQGKHNEGSLKLRYLLELSEGGSLATFDEELSIATASKNFDTEKNLAPLPVGDG